MSIVQLKFSLLLSNLIAAGVKNSNIVPVMKMHDFGLTGWLPYVWWVLFVAAFGSCRQSTYPTLKNKPAWVCGKVIGFLSNFQVVNCVIGL